MKLVAVALAPSGPSAPEVVQECRGVLERHARSFSAAAVFLTPQMRDDAAIAYAFCRLVDDSVDEAQSEASARFELARIERMLNSPKDATPIIRAYIDLCGRAGIGLGPARDLILGARSDLGRVRIQNDEEFFRYCYRVAGTVGMMMCGILGVREQQARRHAIDLGLAMQITNICRDVLEDARMDRVYLPRQRLLAQGLDSEQVAQLGVESSVVQVSELVRDGIAEVVRGLLIEADHYYDSGAAGFSFIPRRPRVAIAVARALYRQIGVTLRAKQCDALSGRVRVSRFKKFTLTIRSVTGCFFGMFSVARGPLLTPGTHRLLQK